MKKTLEIKNLNIVANNKKILKGINLKIRQGEVHVLMGPNGAGKTSLAMAVMGNPGYQITDGQMTVDGKNITRLTPDERARLGIFISFQKPVEIPGVSVRNLLRQAVKEDLERKIGEAVTDLKINERLLTQSMENFSGGEGKLLELLQAKVLASRFLILDEIDSGLDVDSLRLVTDDIKKMAYKSAILLITHNPRILKFIKADCIHVLIRGYIVRSGDRKLGQEIEERGFKWLAK